MLKTNGILLHTNKAASMYPAHKHLNKRPFQSIQVHQELLNITVRPRHHKAPRRHIMHLLLVIRRDNIEPRIFPAHSLFQIRDRPRRVERDDDALPSTERINLELTVMSLETPSEFKSINKRIDAV